jgi:hypothetical protein
MIDVRKLVALDLVFNGLRFVFLIEFAGAVVVTPACRRWPDV